MIIQIELDTNKNKAEIYVLDRVFELKPIENRYELYENRLILRYFSKKFTLSEVAKAVLDFVIKEVRKDSTS